MNLSIILPVYNAQYFIRESLFKLTKFLKNLDFISKVQIVIVNDGSKDDSLKEIQKFVEEFKLEEKSENFKFDIVSYQQNRNIGFAIREGIKKVENEIVIIMDCDLPFKLEVIPESLNLIKDCDLVSVDRTKKAESYNVGFIRKVLHKGLIFVIKMMFRKYVKGVPDFVAGFKVIKKELLYKIKDYFIANTSLVHFEIILYSKIVANACICFVNPILDSSTLSKTTYSLRKTLEVVLKILKELVKIRGNIKNLGK